MTSRTDRPDEKIEFLIGKVSGNPRAMLMLARSLLLPNGMTARAEDLCRDALKLAPNDAEVKALVQTMRARSVGSWYFTMIRDERRHALYAEALRKTLPTGCTVLDIGAGTGLFAMLAAREGAGRVIACERNRLVAEAAAEIVDRNGYADRVTVIAKDSRQLEIGTDLDAPADVLLWDNLSNDLFGAGAVETIEDARRRLLKPGAAILPKACEVRVALVEAKDDSGIRMGVAEGFDMSAFNRLRPTQVTLGSGNFDCRSNSATLFDVDFEADAIIEPETNRARVTATGGRVDGIVQWLRFQISDGTFYDTGEDDAVTAFGMQYHAVEPFDAQAGQEIVVAGAHDRQRSWFWVADAIAVKGA